jgi:hypothetical protein
VIEVRARISDTYDQIIEQTRKNMDQFVWTTIKSVEDLGHMRMEAMRMFLDDYEMGKQEGRYVEASLPSLPFVDGEFDLALCSHFSFSIRPSWAGFHRTAIRELCRVAREARVSVAGARRQVFSVRRDGCCRSACRWTRGPHRACSVRISTRREPDDADSRPRTLTARNSCNLSTPPLTACLPEEKPHAASSTVRRLHSRRHLAEGRAHRGPAARRRSGSGRASHDDDGGRLRGWRPDSREIQPGG